MIKRILIAFLAVAARRVIRREKPRIIAVTGSFGKSSAKEAVAVALGAEEPGSSVRSSPKNYNNEFGLPFTIFGVSAPGRDPLKWGSVLLKACWLGWGFGRVRASAFVLEMGADRRGDLAWLVKIAPPDVAVVTGVGKAHSEYFGTVEEIAAEKATIVRALSKLGYAILNADDARATAMRRETEAETAYFGFSEGSDIRILRAVPMIEVDEAGQSVPVGIEIAIEAERHAAEVRLRGTVGQAQAFAVAAAIAVARRFDIPMSLAVQRLESAYHGIAGRTRVIPGIKGTTIIDDSYNAASPETVISAVRDLSLIPLSGGEQRRIAVLGDMRELGVYEEESHRTVARTVVESGVDVLVTCGTLAQAIADTAREIGMDSSQIRVFTPETSGRENVTADAGRYLQDLLKTGDVLLVKGSQGMRMERIVKELMAEPDEAPFLLVRMTEDWVGK